MLRQEARKVGIVARPRARGFAAEALHALRHIGLEADAWLLAVVHHVDAAGRLLLHDMAHRARALPGQFRPVHRFARLVADQEVGQHRIARQAADVGRENSLFAALHGLSR